MKTLSLIVVAHGVQSRMERTSLVQSRLSRSKRAIDFGKKSDNPLADIEYYGCWCYTGTSYTKGRGPTVDIFDTICQELNRGYTKAVDTEKSSGISCDPLKVEYETTDYGWTEEEIRADCVKSNDNVCAIEACVAEGVFITEFFEQLWSAKKPNLDYMHENGFNIEETCIEIEEEPETEIELETETEPVNEADLLKNVEKVDPSQDLIDRLEIDDTILEADDTDIDGDYAGLIIVHPDDAAYTQMTTRSDFDADGNCVACSCKGCSHACFINKSQKPVCACPQTMEFRNATVCRKKSKNDAVPLPKLGSVTLADKTIRLLNKPDHCVAKLGTGFRKNDPLWLVPCDMKLSGVKNVSKYRWTYDEGTSLIISIGSKKSKGRKSKKALCWSAGKNWKSLGYNPKRVSLQKCDDKDKSQQFGLSQAGRIVLRADQDMCVSFKKNNGYGSKRYGSVMISKCLASVVLSDRQQDAKSPVG